MLSGNKYLVCLGIFEKRKSLKGAFKSVENLIKKINRCN